MEKINPDKQSKSWMKAKCVRWGAFLPGNYCSVTPTLFRLVSVWKHSDEHKIVAKPHTQKKTEENTTKTKAERKINFVRARQPSVWSSSEILSDALRQFFVNAKPRSHLPFKRKQNKKLICSWTKHQKKKTVSDNSGKLAAKSFRLFFFSSVLAVAPPPPRRRRRHFLFLLWTRDRGYCYSYIKGLVI